MNTIKTPATVREAGDMAHKLGMTLSEFLQMLGPIPMPPVGYTLAPRSEDRWTGPETFNRGWIITPAWNATTDTHSIEVWMADHTPPQYANLSPADALQLAADLTAAARAAGATE
jgi:hypothetical protein